jgi:hypothetical protein
VRFMAPEAAGRFLEAIQREFGEAQADPLNPELHFSW